MDSLVVGDPWDDRTDIGPLIRREHLQSVEAYVERALAGGAEIVAGGRPHGLERGYYMSPALVGNVANDAEILSGGALRPGRRRDPGTTRSTKRSRSQMRPGTD